MSETMPTWAISNGSPDAEKIIKYLYRYGYVKEVDGETYVDKKLHEDYPAIYNMLFAYQMDMMTKKYTDMIAAGKFSAYRDDEGKLKYRMDDE